MKLSASFGTVLKKLRKQRGLSQSELANLSQLDRTYISLLECGKRQPTLTTIYQLSRTLKTSPEEIVRRTIRHLENPSRKSFIASKRL